MSDWQVSAVCVGAAALLVAYEVWAKARARRRGCLEARQAEAEQRIAARKGEPQRG